MKLINARGRVLLEVTSAAWTDEVGSAVMYSYRGDGVGGCNFIEGVHRLIECIKSDAPSAKLVGTLPEPK